jgi:hypothetical protein
MEQPRVILLRNLQGKFYLQDMEVGLGGGISE